MKQHRFLVFVGITALALATFFGCSSQASSQTIPSVTLGSVKDFGHGVFFIGVNADQLDQTGATLAHFVAAHPDCTVTAMNTYFLICTPNTKKALVNAP